LYQVKKTILLLSLAVLALSATAKDPIECPSGYYDNALGKSGEALLTALYNIITTHTNVGYNGLWDAYADTDTGDDGYLIDMYSTYDKYTVSNKCGNYSAIGDCINREHSLPKSWWGGGKAAQYSDIFNIYPTDGYVNNQRSAYPYGECENGTRLSNGSYVAKGRLGTSTFDGYSGTVFEPDDEYKGDFARSYFYMAACYNNLIKNWTSGNGGAMLAGNSYPVFTTYAINLLLSWHRLDPVSDKEIKRNNYAYAWQDNRNPFIDHPELAEYIWGNKSGETWNGEDEDDDTPRLTAPSNGTTINVGTILASGTSVSKQVTVKGENLTQNLTVTVTGSDFAVSPATLTASDVMAGTTVTVTYGGEATTATGTLVISSSEASTTCTLTSGKETGGGSEGTDTIGGSATIETWEGCESGGYWTQDVQGAAWLWAFYNAGLFAQSNDKWNDELGCRFGKTSSSYIMMQEDVTTGASGISFYAATYGSGKEADATLKVQYSTDGGSSWTDVGSVTLTTTWTQYSFALDVAGNVRFKLLQTAGARLNVDDIAIYARTGGDDTPVASIQFASAIDAMHAYVAGTSTISTGAVTTQDNSDDVMLTVDGNFEISVDQLTWATSLTLDASGETFYVRLADTNVAGSFDGTLTAVAGEVVAYADVEGTVTLLGDVNMDGTVDISDVTTLIDLVLGGNPSPCDTIAADVDLSGVIDISDVTALIDIVLSGNTTVTTAPMRLMPVSWTALPMRGGITIMQQAGETLEVYDMDARVVATVSTSQVVQLPAGTYVVASDTRSCKVVVK